MSARVSKAGMPSMHTAGIYSDMTVDGPEIGDLIVILDKAKNLPNRKTIGKQDPYCAARLGKEAKKTETDKRGGQTPRWDQELRFTVHDSADYYQLKVSVFNDDKKTDLIGEAWVNLEDVIVLGGGRYDGWHNLNYRGKYAGEIRIELTYYDIRPKVERPSETRRDSGRNELQNPERDSLGGPRQLKQVKRRPLPADPTAASSSTSSLPLHPSEHVQHPAVTQASGPTYQDFTGAEVDAQYPGAHFMAESALPGSRHMKSHSSSEFNIHPPTSHYPPTRYESVERDDSFGHLSQEALKLDDTVAMTGNDRVQHTSQLRRAPDTYAEGDFQHAAETVAPPQAPSHNTRNSQVLARPPVPKGVQGLQHSYSAPPETLHTIDQSNPDQRTYTPYSIKNDGYSQTVPRHHSQDNASVEQPISDEERPPPPPVHRSSANGVNATQNGRQPVHDQMGYPAPLKVSQRAAPTTPASYSPHGMQRNSLPASSSPHGIYTHAQAGAQAHGQIQYTQPMQAQIGPKAASPTRDGYPGMPASLLPGYDSKVASGPVDRVVNERAARRMSQVEFGSSEVAHASPIYAQNSTARPQVSPVHSSRLVEDIEPPRQHRSSAPVMGPVAINPDPRTPSRKSVTPRPVEVAPERSLSGVPFSPDAYDALNPSAISPGHSDTASRYQTPERAKDAAPRESRDAGNRGTSEGPIIGTDGRLIDPSDHLPTDTWAPEPEKKTPQKTARAEFRLRHSPQGAQPMPQATRRLPREPVPRPHSYSTPIYAPNAEPQTPPQGTPAVSTRNRLQKRLRMQVSSPGLAANSSPLASYDSQTDTTTVSPRSLPRNTQADRVLREHENYQGFSNQSSPAGYSPGYGSGGEGSGRRVADTRSSPIVPTLASTGSSAPPVPAKLPLSTGREDYSALSEELKSINIGSVGRQQRGVRRSVY